MCGRFTLRATSKELHDFFDHLEIPETIARFNIAPTQDVLAVREPGKAEFLRWGLVPFWADDPKIGSQMINARSDTVAEKPAFRASFKKRRCLVLGDGFYEWKKSGRARMPYHIRRRDGKPWAFAGLWDHWHKDDVAIDSCTILTTDANAVVAPLHDRMPVILRPRDYETWLKVDDPGRLLELCVPMPAEEMEAVPANPYVNNARHEGAECLAEERMLF